MKFLITGLVASRCEQQLLFQSGEREGQHLVANMGHTLSNHIRCIYSVSVGYLHCEKCFDFGLFVARGKCMHPKITEIL